MPSLSHRGFKRALSSKAFHLLAMDPRFAASRLVLGEGWTWEDGHFKVGSGGALPRPLLLGSWWRCMVCGWVGR